MPTDKKLIGTGILSALAASLCCITPLLAVIAGSSSLAINISWLEPLRPFLILLTLVVLGIAWFRKLKAVKKPACDCPSESRNSFTGSTTFLVLLTIVTILLLSLPYWMPSFSSGKQSAASGTTAPGTTLQSVFTVRGMTCTGCEEHVNAAVSQLPGIVRVSTSYKDKNSTVIFDTTQTSISDIEAAIHTTGYKVIKTDQHSYENH